MGNLLSCGLGNPHTPFIRHVVKLVHSNGLVEEFHRSVKAGELLVDYPHHFICHFDSLTLLVFGSSSSPEAGLSAEDDMEIGQIYFLLPKHVLDSPLTSSDVAALVSKATVARKASYKGFNQFAPLPLPQVKSELGADAARNSDGTGGATSEENKQPLVSREYVQQVLAEARLQMERRAAADPALKKQLGSNAELQSAFTSHIVAKSCARLWRPPLETIYEDIHLMNQPTN